MMDKMSAADETSLHLRIKAVQSQIRIAVQNHQVLFERLQASPNDSEVAHFIQIIQELILSMGRTQMELMYQFKQEVRQKYPKEEQKTIMMAKLGWPDRFSIKPRNITKAGGGVIMDPEKRYQIMRKKQMLPTRPGVKMQSLLKVNNSNNSSSSSILLPRKESERLKAAAASKLSELTLNVSKPVKTLNAALKIKNDKSISTKHQETTHMLRRSSISNNKFGKLSKDSSLIGAGKALVEVTSIVDLSQDNYLQYFGLIHKDKSKNIVVNQRKRKRRSAAGQSNFYNDYYQPRKLNSKKSPTPSVPQSPCSSQDVIDVDEYEAKSGISINSPRVNKQSILSSPKVKPDVNAESSTKKSRNSPEGESKLSNPEVSKDNGDEIRLANKEDVDASSSSANPIASPANSPAMDTTGDMDSEKEADAVCAKIDKSPPNEESESNEAEVIIEEKLHKDNTESTSFPTKLPIANMGKTVDEATPSPVDGSEPLPEVTVPPINSPIVESKLTVDPIVDEASCINDESKPTTSSVDSADLSPEDEPSEMTPEVKDSIESEYQGGSTSPVNPPEEEVQPVTEITPKSNICVICFEGSASGNFDKCNQCSEYFHKECNTSSISTCPLCYSFPPSLSTIVGVTSTSPTLTTSSDCSEVVKRYLGNNKDTVESEEVKLEEELTFEM